MTTRIAVDTRLLSKRGIGRYIESLYDSLLDLDIEREYLFLTAPGTIPKFAARANATLVETTAPYYSVQEQWRLPSLLRKLRADLLHSPHFLLPFCCPCPAVATIHDTAYLTSGADLPNPVGRVYYRATMRWAARSAAAVMTVSEFCKAEIVRALGVAPRRIVTTPLAASGQFRPVAIEEVERTRHRLQLPAKFFLHIGIDRRRKNVEGLVEGFGRFVETGNDDYELVLVGEKSERSRRELDQHVERLRLQGRIRGIKAVSENDLPALYSAACALVLPSWYEGFGLPVLESMACGTPVITSNLSALPEVAGGAAELVDPGSPHAIAGAMRRLAANPSYRLRLAGRGSDRAAQFTWLSTAERTLSTFQHVLNGSIGTSVSGQPL